MPTRVVKCQACTKAWLAEYEENCEAALVCPECGADSPILYNAMVLAHMQVNGKQVQIDCPVEICACIVPGLLLGFGRDGLTICICGETHTWPWANVLSKMGVVK